MAGSTADWQIHRQRQMRGCWCTDRCRTRRVDRDNGSVGPNDIHLNDVPCIIGYTSHTCTGSLSAHGSVIHYSYEVSLCLDKCTYCKSTKSLWSATSPPLVPLTNDPSFISFSFPGAHCQFKSSLTHVILSSVTLPDYPLLTPWPACLVESPEIASAFCLWPQIQQSHPCGCLAFSIYNIASQLPDHPPIPDHPAPSRYICPAECPPASTTMKSSASPLPKTYSSFGSKFRYLKKKAQSKSHPFHWAINHTACLHLGPHTSTCTTRPSCW